MTGKDPVAESKATLKTLKASASKVKTVPNLTAWWRSHGADIAQLTADDREALAAHCSDRKLAILEAESKPKTMFPTSSRMMRSGAMARITTPRHRCRCTDPLTTNGRAAR
jgi:hypothetical protein